MEKLVRILIRYKVAVISLTLLLVVCSAFASLFVGINYDLAQYLPEDSMTKISIDVVKKEFGYTGMAEVMVEDIDLNQALAIKNIILQVDGVKGIIWLDDLADLSIPFEMLPRSMTDNYFKDSSALYRVEFTGSDYSTLTDQALDDIRTALAEYKSYYAGTAQDSKTVRDIVSDEILGISAVVVPICILILLFASRSWIEPLIYLIVIGVSIVFNMGTNIIFKDISFITHSMSAVLQLAISLDYSLFIFHRYVEERDKGTGYDTAIAIAVRRSFISVFASAMTTVAGFAALLFMRYRIGADMGLVLAKGVILSFLSAILVMPVVLYLFRKVIDKTAHRDFVPSFDRLSRMTVKMKYVFAIAGALILIVAFLAQRNNTFIYGDTSRSDGDDQTSQTSDKTVIAGKFGTYNPLVLLVPREGIAKEAELAAALQNTTGIRSVIAFVTVVDPSIPIEMVPSGTLDMFYSQNYARLTILLESGEESQENFAAVESIKAAAEMEYPGKWYLVGKASSVSDIRDSVEKDSSSVMLFSVLAVFLIVLISLRSFAIPVLLIAVIQGSIWINMSIPYFTGTGLVFIGYMIISALQLGATIDYAILLSGRYKDFRLTMKPKDAAAAAVSTAGISVAVSSMILAVAGFAEGFMSRIPSVSAIGILLGRGAALSGIMVIFVLPGLLVLFDKLIIHSTIGLKHAVREIRPEKKTRM
ncbi:MAG: efflux RND transporter permease subunit [Saccharofermentanales bacterium]